MLQGHDAPGGRMLQGQDTPEGRMLQEAECSRSPGYSRGLYSYLNGDLACKKRPHRLSGEGPWSGEFGELWIRFHWKTSQNL